MLRPIGDRILVEVAEVKKQTEGGIFIPEQSQQKPTEGKVISVGEGYHNSEGKWIAPLVKEGDVILFGKYAGTEVTYDSKSYLIMRNEDILGIVE